MNVDVWHSIPPAKTVWNMLLIQSLYSNVSLLFLFCFVLFLLVFAYFGSMAPINTLQAERNHFIIMTANSGLWLSKKFYTNKAWNSPKQFPHTKVKPWPSKKKFIISLIESTLKMMKNGFFIFFFLKIFKFLSQHFGHVRKRFD